MIFTLIGCDKKPTSFTITTTQPTTQMTTDSELTTQLKQIYQLAVKQANYTGTYEEWLETVRGPQGIPGLNGEEVMLQVASGYIQWKYDNDTTWTNLISLDSLRGETGLSGKEVLFRVDSNYIQWQYSNDATWTNLIALSSLIGPSGSDGQEVIFQVDSGYIQWKYDNETTWTNLVELSSLIGPQGVPGLNGQEIELRVNDTILEWRYRNTETWYYLYDLIVLEGEDAKTPVITINEEGYWVIDGVIQPTKAYTTIKCAVDFNLNGGTMPSGYPLSIVVDKGNSMNLPIPEKPGYIFTGWLTGYTVNDTLFNNYLPVTKDMTLIASWEVDSSLISDYFNLVNQNHAFDYTLNLDLSDGTNSYYYDVFNYYFQNITATDPFNYLLSQTSINIPFMSSPTVSQEKSTIYDSELNQYLVIKQRTNNLMIEKLTFVDAFDHYLGNLNPELFTMSNTSLIYDYHGDMEDFITPFYDMLLLYGVNLQSNFDYLEENCTLNLITNILTYSANGTFTVAEYGELSFNLSVAYEFIPYNEETMILPMDILKDTITNQLNFVINQQRALEYYEYVYPESLAAFDALVLQKQNTLSSIDNIKDLAYFYLNDIPCITNYVFDINTDLMYIDDYLFSMDLVLSYYSDFATQASINAMTVIYGNYYQLMTNLSSTDIYDDLGYHYFNDYIDEIKAAQYLDINQLFLSYYKEEKTEELMFFSSLFDTFTLYSEFEAFVSLIDGWVTTINSQSSVELINSTYDDAIQSIISFTYDYNDILGILYAQTENLVMNMIYGKSYLASDGNAFTAYVNSIATDLYTQTDAYQWVIDANEFIKLANLYLINDIKTEKMANLEVVKNELAHSISSEDYLIIQAEADLLITLLEQLIDVLDYIQLYDAFIENTTKIPVDPWVSMKNEVIAAIEEEYAYLYSMATTDSQTELIEVMNSFNLSIDALVTDDEAGLMQLRTDTFIQLDLSFVVASEYEELYLAKEEYLAKWDDFYNQGVPYVDLSNQTIDELLSYYIDYRNDILNAMEVIDVINDYHEGCTMLAYLSYSYLTFTVLNNVYRSLLNDYLDAWALIYPNASEIAPSYILEFEYRLEDNVSPYLTIYEYNEYRIELDDNILGNMRGTYENSLNILYDEYLSQINPEDYVTLDSIYQLAWDAIYAETVWVNFDSVLTNFTDQANQLVTP